MLARCLSVADKVMLGARFALCSGRRRKRVDRRGWTPQREMWLPAEHHLLCLAQCVPVRQVGRFSLRACSFEALSTCERLGP